MAFCSGIVNQRCTVDGIMPANAIPGLTLAGTEVNGIWENGLIVYGVPVGSDEYVKIKMRQKVEEVAKGALRATQVLGSEKQGLGQY